MSLHGEVRNDVNEICGNRDDVVSTVIGLQAGQASPLIEGRVKRFLTFPKFPARL